MFPRNCESWPLKTTVISADTIKLLYCCKRVTALLGYIDFDVFIIEYGNSLDATNTNFQTVCLPPPPFPHPFSTTLVQMFLQSGLLQELCEITDCMLPSAITQLLLWT